MDITKPNNNIEDLELLTRQKVYCLLDHLKHLWLDVYIFESLRSLERQKRLLWWGRSASELKKFWIESKFSKQKDQSGKVYPQRSWTLISKHLTWEAVDIVFDINKDPKIKVPSWNGNYSLVIKLGSMYWLDTLAPLELCHLQNNWRSIESCIWYNAQRRDKADQNTKDQLHRANQRMRAIKK